MAPEPAGKHEITIPEAISLGIQAQRSGQFEAAREIFSRVLAAWPECPDALHFSGLLAFHRGETALAVDLIEKSLRFAPAHADFWNNFGNVLKALGQHPDAIAAYGNALRLRPDFADANNNLGVMAAIVDDFDTAVAEFQRAIASEPKHAGAYLNLGSALAHLERLDESVAAFQKAADLRPAEPVAYARLGHVLWKLGRMHEAAEAIRRNIDFNPTDSHAFVVLAGIFHAQGNFEECFAAYRGALKIKPDDSRANFLYGQTLVLNGRAGEARQLWKDWSALDPQNPVPRHLMAAGSDDEIPARSGDDFVVTVFDRFAETFDEKLKKLEYRAPELVATALRAALPAGAGSLEILDAGCGTGLCGPLLRSLAGRLTGVDLSPKMLDKARDRGGYDELTAAELTAFISAQMDAWDAIVSADTLCYFGKLEAVFAAISGALRPGGLLAFTVEKTPAEHSAARVTLEQSGRYTHTESYVRAALDGAGLTVVQLATHTLRTEFFRPVEGMVVVARKSPGPSKVAGQG